jgi:MarR family transcriptional regulator for hemolysin
MANADLSMGYMMNWAARVFRRLADRRLKPLGFSSGHLPVLNALIQADGMSQKALIEVSAMEQPTMAATLARMERDGLVERRADPNDGRAVLYSLTTATIAKVPAIKAAIEQMNTEALRTLPEDQRDQFRAQLQAMIVAMETMVVDES